MGLKNFFSKADSNSFWYRNRIKKIKQRAIPRHVAIIMDGNGRWAQKRGLPRTEGHRQGVEALRDIIKISSQLGIKYLTLYAFSTENWKRPKSEIEAIMSLLVEYIETELEELDRNKVKIVVLGDTSALSKTVQNAISKAVNQTADNKSLQLNIALNYGGRAEIVRGVKRIVQDVVNNKLLIDDIDEEVFSKYLYTANMPDPDLLIRTGGEQRISNFLLYQIAYSELWFSNSRVYWPDFNARIYLKSIQDYQRRQRRYGGIVAEE